MQTLKLLGENGAITAIGAGGKTRWIFTLSPGDLDSRQPVPQNLLYNTEIMPHKRAGVRCSLILEEGQRD
jgi:hypothetical protein